MDYTYTVHGILQASILEWEALPFSRGPSQPRDRTQVSALQVASLPAEPQRSPRILEWVAYPFSRGSSWPTNQTGVSWIAGGFFTNWAIKEKHRGNYNVAYVKLQGFPSGSVVKNQPAMQETQETRVQFLDWEDPLEKGMATHSSILAWKIPWTEEAGGLQSIGSHRVGHDWSEWTCVRTHTHAHTHACSNRNMLNIQGNDSF